MYTPKGNQVKRPKKRKLLNPFVRGFNSEAFHSSCFYLVSWNNPLSVSTLPLRNCARLIYLWSLKVRPYLLRLISPVLCTLFSPVWLNVHICSPLFRLLLTRLLIFWLILKLGVTVSLVLRPSPSPHCVFILPASYCLVFKCGCEFFPLQGNAWALSFLVSLFLVVFFLRP